MLPVTVIPITRPSLVAVAIPAAYPLPALAPVPMVPAVVAVFATAIAPTVAAFVLPGSAAPPLGVKNERTRHPAKSVTYLISTAFLA